MNKPGYRNYWTDLIQGGTISGFDPAKCSCGAIMTLNEWAAHCDACPKAVPVAISRAEALAFRGSNVKKP